MRIRVDRYESSVKQPVKVSPEEQARVDLVCLVCGIRIEMRSIKTCLGLRAGERADRPKLAKETCPKRRLAATNSHHCGGVSSDKTKGP